MPHTSDQADSSSNATAAEATTAARQAQCSKAAQDRPVCVVAAKPSRNAPRKMEWMSLPNSAVDRRAPALKRIDRIDRLPVSLLFPVARDAWRSMAPYGPPPPGSHSDATRKRPSLSSRVTRVRERERERERGGDVTLLPALIPIALTLTGLVLFCSVAEERVGCLASRFCRSNFASCIILSSSKLNIVGLPAGSLPSLSLFRRDGIFCQIYVGNTSVAYSFCGGVGVENWSMSSERLATLIRIL